MKKLVLIIVFLLLGLLASEIFGQFGYETSQRSRVEPPTWSGWFAEWAEAVHLLEVAVIALFVVLGLSTFSPMRSKKTRWILITCILLVLFGLLVSEVWGQQGNDQVSQLTRERQSHRETLQLLLWSVTANATLLIYALLVTDKKLQLQQHIKAKKIIESYGRPVMRDWPIVIAFLIVTFASTASADLITDFSSLEEKSEIEFGQIEDIEFVEQPPPLVEVDQEEARHQPSTLLVVGVILVVLFVVGWGIVIVMIMVSAWNKWRGILGRIFVDIWTK